MPTAEELKQKAEKLKREAARLQKKALDRERGDDTKKKILFGAAAIELCASNETFRHAFMAHLDKYITRDADRRLLGQLCRKKD